MIRRALQPSAGSPARLVLLAFLLLAALGCDGNTRSAAPPRLAELPLEPDVKASGERLMRAPDGLHRLDAGSAAARAVVAVHGGESAGYEWIYALHELAKQGARVYFFRYDWRRCPELPAGELRRELVALTAREPGIRELAVLGHSYGGIVTGLMAREYAGTVPLEVHLIASPLAGLPTLSERCRYQAFTAQPLPGVTYREWRTRKHIDGAFKSLAEDPQQVTIPGSRVVTLPESYRGHRLGHNWSISWVADELTLERNAR